MVCCQVQWVQLGKEDQGPLKREQEALLVLGHGGGSGAGRLVDSPLASQTRVDTGDTDVRQTPPPHLLSHPLPSSLVLCWNSWPGSCGCTYLEVPGGEQTKERSQEKGLGQTEWMETGRVRSRERKPQQACLPTGRQL